MMISYDDGRDGAVVMTSSDDGLLLAMGVIRTIAHDLDWPDWSPSIRRVVPLNETVFDRFSGTYKMQDGPIFTFWREGSQAYFRLVGQRAGELFAMSDREYTGEDIDARVQFQVSGPRTKSAVTVYQGFAAHHGTLLPGPLGRAYLEKSEADYVRFQKQIPDPRSAARLRGLLIGLAEGRPDYSGMEPNMVQATYRYLPGLRKMLLPLGTLNTMAFERVTPAGDDVYDVQFAEGSRRAMIGLSPTGRISAAGFPP